MTKMAPSIQVLLTARGRLIQTTITIIAQPYSMSQAKSLNYGYKLLC